MTQYETVVGLEVHVQLNTKTKIFCACSTNYSNKPPNTHTCEVCLGYPGTLPVMNSEVLNSAIKACISLNCEIPDVTKFDRKHYFYPDLPKAYQISQLDQPIGQHGYLEIESPSEQRGTKRIGITRIHMEEDAGKLSHSSSNGESLIDYNRGGVPLLEIVSEPHINNAAEARAYLSELRLILLYLGISDCDMENGSLRCDLNISVRPTGESRLGTRVEVKNMNSFRSLGLALEYERDRQIHTLRNKGKLVQCTRLWDEVRLETRMMRLKEDEDDYRYFPEPDIPPIQLSEELLENFRKNLPELPKDRFKRFVSFGLLEENVQTLVTNKDWGDFFDESCKFVDSSQYVSLSNWIITELGGWLRDNSFTKMDELKLTPFSMGELLNCVKEGQISGKQAKKVLFHLLEQGGQVSEVIEALGLKQISDDGQLKDMVLQVIRSNPTVLDDLREGKTKALGFMMGQIMKLSKGQANPGKVNQLLRQTLLVEFEIKI